MKCAKVTVSYLVNASKVEVPPAANVFALAFVITVSDSTNTLSPTVFKRMPVYPHDLVLTLEGVKLHK